MRTGRVGGTFWAFILTTARISNVIYQRAHRRILFLLIVACVAAGLLPAMGKVLHAGNFGSFGLGWGLRLNFSTPSMLLAVLLINAGFSLEIRSANRIFSAFPLLMTTLILNGLIPLCLAAVLTLLGVPQSITAALTIIASVPIAGSSTAWAQNSGGSIPFSLTLVIFSTLLGPITCPLIFWVGSHLTPEPFRTLLQTTALNGASSFFASAIILPTAIGLLLRAVTPARLAQPMKSFIRLFSLFCLIALNYVNASVVLPEVIRHPNVIEILSFLSVAAILNLIAFSTGWYFPKLFAQKGQRDIRISVLFGLGMSNNGAGLVMASVVMADHPRVLLLILLYNLVQQLGAAICHSRLTEEAELLEKSMGPANASLSAV